MPEQLPVAAVRPLCVKMDLSSRCSHDQFVIGMDMTENEISRHVVECAIEVHRTLGGPGLLESVYEEALCWELQQRRLEVQRQLALPILYKGQTLASPLRIDLMVNRLVIVECKAVGEYNPIFEIQTLTYLRLAEIKLGMVVNFGERMVKNGIHRVVNGL